MKILRLRIEGFRGIKTADITFSSHSVLIGPNGCGKSSLVDALSLTLGRSRMVRPLTEHDFTDSNPGPPARIRIIVTLGGFLSDDPGDHDEWFQSGRGVPKWVDEQGREQAAPALNRKLCVNLGFSARFDRDELEVVSFRYFHDDDDATDPFDDAGALSHVPARLITEIGFFVLPAKRDWDAVASFNSELFRRTISNTAGIPADEIIDQRDALRRPSTTIENSSKLSSLVNGLNARLRRLGANALKFQLRVTAGDCESVLHALLPHYELTSGLSLPAARHGSGLVSLQSLLLLLEVGRIRLDKGLPFILALEEPELHLAPGLQGRLVAESMATANQVLATTHSPEVARVFESTSVMVVTNHEGDVTAHPFLKQDLAIDATNNERKLFIQNRSRVVGALMLPFVLVPEGRFDAEWLNRFAEVADSQMTNTTPFSAVFGVVPTENAAVVFTVGKLVPLRKRVMVLVDGDAAGTTYLEELLAAIGQHPKVIFQLPLSWTIENVVRWILLPGGEAVLTMIKSALPAFQFASLDELLVLLKVSNNHKTNTLGLKEDVLAHEAIIGIIDSNAACRVRTVDFCEALVSAANGNSHTRLEKLPSSTESVTVVRFQP